MQRQASGLLVLVVLTLFLSTLLVWGYVVSMYVTKQNNSQHHVVRTWRV